MKVSAIKRRLAAHGFWPKGWPFNEGRGPRTVARIKAFQKAAGLEVDGVVGPLTAAALNSPGFHRAKGERATAVRWALSKVGTVEHPAGSNQGPGITRWQEDAGFPGGGVAWCQVFCDQSAKQGTNGRMKPSWFGGYTVSVVDQANAGEHGLKRVHLSDARPGDWVYFKFPGESSEFCDHVGIFLADQGSTIRTCEGNTSAADGSQSNGGGVFLKSRSKSLVAAVVRVPYRS